MKNIFHIIIRGRPSEIKSYIEENERYLSPGALVLGFILDSLTLTRVDLLFDNLVFLFYLAISGLSIFLLNAYDAERIGKKFERLIPWLPLGIQFAFGGIFSGFVVLYSRSASFAASWPFIILLGVILIGNEFLKKRYERLFFQLGLYYIAVFSYLIFAIPVILNSMGPLIFILSGVTSLLVIAVVIRIIFSIAPWKIYFNEKTILGTILGIFAIFNILYFTNIIPPIPLSSKDIVIAHNVNLKPDGAEVTFEPSPWYQPFKDFDNVYHRTGNEPVYVYSSIYAPANLEAEIVHEWAFFNESLGKWIVTDQIQYQIFGGRNEGYRGFSIKSNISPGEWRVDVKTKRGQLLGRTKIEIIQADSIPKLITEIR